MKEIGEQLKTARESIGVSIEEVAEDLKVRPTQVENIEAGNSEAFDDIFYLKYFIRDYAKYLGLNKEDLVDEFNEYLFDYTSRLSLDDIKMAAKEAKPTKAVKSPYTYNKKRKIAVIPVVVYGVLAILISVIIYFVITINVIDDDFEEGTIITEKK
ncbi:MAG: helix-turn-helix domain-containing protein [Bacilli bacterium]|nr:helix-turn-helix domain-containing protein [Bacilli bacterium]